MRWAIIVLAACGRIGFDPTAPSGDASVASAVGCTPSETPGPFHTDFNTGPDAWAIVYHPAPVQITFANGVMMGVPGDAASPTYGGIYSPKDDFHNRRVFVEVSSMVDIANGGIAGIGVERGSRGEPYVAWFQQSGTLFAEIDVGGVFDTSMVPYDPVAHRWLQLREHGGTETFEISPDGMTWMVVAEKPTPAYVGNAYVDVFVGTEMSAAGNLGSAVFDNLFDCLTP